MAPASSSASRNIKARAPSLPCPYMTPSPGTVERPARILVVEDDEDSREVLDIVLSHEGFLVVTAAGGEEALASVAQERPDLILLDGRMPGMDGYEVAAKLKGDPATQDIPIIMITGMTDDVSRLRALNAGAEGVIGKPIGRADVVCASEESALRLKTDGDE